MIRRLITVLVVHLTLGLCARGEILLKGIMIADGAPQFSLYSVEEKTGKWLKLGQSFFGYKVAEYDPQAEVLTLVKGDVREAVRLQGSRVKDSTPEETSARLRSVTGLELAYELAKRGDSEMANMLKMYQELLELITFFADPNVKPTPTPARIKSVTSQAETMRSRLEKIAAEKATAILAAASPP